MKFSKSILTDLLILSTNEFVNIESRTNVISISTNEHVLELGVPCPPNCP